MADDIRVEVAIEASQQTGAIGVVANELEALKGKAQAAGKGAEDAAKGVGTMEEASKKLQSTLEGLFGAAAISAFFKGAIEESLQEEEALRALKFQVEATGASWVTYRERIEEFATAQQAQTRFDDTVTLEVLGKLTRATGDVGQAMSATALAQDIAAGTSKDLAEVTSILNSLITGQERGITMARKEFAAYVGDAQTTQGVVDALAAAFVGAAASEESHIKTLAQEKHELREIQQQIGDGLVPAFVQIGSLVTMVMRGFEEMGVVIAGLAAGAFQAFGGVGEAIAAAFSGRFSEIPNIARETVTELEVIAEESANKVLEIEARFNEKRGQARQDFSRIVAQQSEEEVRKEKEAAEKKIKDTEKVEKERQKIEQQKIKNVSDVFGVIASISAGENKKLFLATKAAAIAEATIRAYMAYVGALANPPFPPFSIPQAQIALGLGLAGVGVMIGTTVAGLEGGGVAEGVSGTGGRIIRVGENNKREGIIPLQDPRAMTMIAQAIAEAGGGGGGGSVVINNTFVLPGLEALRDPRIAQEILEIVSEEMSRQTPGAVTLSRRIKDLADLNEGRAA